MSTAYIVIGLWLFLASGCILGVAWAARKSIPAQDGPGTALEPGDGASLSHGQELSRLVVSASRHAFRQAASYLALIARLVVGGLFVVTGLAKLFGMERFIQEVRTYEILPLAATNSVALILPWLELICGGLLLLCVWRRESRAVVGVLLVLFTLAKGFAYARGLQIECGCGGNLTFLRYIFDLPQGIVTNLALLGLLIIDRQAEVNLVSEREEEETFAS